MQRALIILTWTALLLVSWPTGQAQDAVALDGIVRVTAASERTREEGHHGEV